VRHEAQPITGLAPVDPDPAPRFSIVVPCYNEADYLAATLRSLQAQTFPGHYEVIVVDNGSTDATAAIAYAHGVRVVVESHRGVCWARQRGTMASTGEIVISADADTIYSPGWLATIDAAFGDDEGIVAVAGPCRYVGGPRWGRAYARVLFGLVEHWYRLTGHTLYVTATNIAFRRRSFPGYDVRLTQGGDELDLLRRLRRQGRVRYDHTNPSYSSSRRLTRGFWYGLFVTLLVYYLLAYGLNRAAGRPVIGSAPAFRGDRARSRRLGLAVLAVALVALIAWVS
jgi:glycosyltransferase involved in cell wall biosynthesis